MYKLSVSYEVMNSLFSLLSNCFMLSKNEQKLSTVSSLVVRKDKWGTRNLAILNHGYAANVGLNSNLVLKSCFCIFYPLKVVCYDLLNMCILI